MAGSYGGRISLDPPPARIVAVGSCLVRDKTHKSDHRKAILSHAFNHAVHVAVPDRPDLPDALVNAAPDGDVYYTAHITPAQLLAPELRALFPDSVADVADGGSSSGPMGGPGQVSDGGLAGVSVGTRIDGGCVAAVVAGTLVLSVDRATYQALGLQGKPSARGSRGERYVVTVDLAERGFVPGAKRYERVRWCLTDRLGLEFPFVFVWASPVDGACGGTVCTQLEAVLHAKVTRVAGTGWVLRSVSVPLLERAVANVAALGDDEHVELCEWLGAVACGVAADGSPMGYHTTMGCPEPHRVSDAIAAHTWRGMLAPSRIAAMLAAADAVVAAGEAPWVAITVWGFQDAPLSWGRVEHGFVEGGENHVTYVVGDAHRYLRFTAVDPGDGCP